MFLSDREKNAVFFYKIRIFRPTNRKSTIYIYAEENASRLFQVRKRRPKIREDTKGKKTHGYGKEIRNDG